jgi:HSP20 family protein
MPELKVSKPETKAVAEHKPFFPFPFGGELFTNAFPMLRQFAEELDRSFVKHIWAPPLEVSEKEGVFLATLELPGITKDDLKVEVTEEMLTVTGERKLEKETKEENVFRSERYYGKFHRQIMLPKEAKVDQIKAELKNGVLAISIPVPNIQAKARTVPVVEGPA